MVTVDSTASPVRLKRRGRGATKRRRIRHRIGRRSAKLVKTGTIDLTPCLVCGSQEDLTIHHVEPIKPDRFVFLCEPCHVLAHTPVFRTMDVCVASGHFSIRPEALVRRTDTPAVPPGSPPVASGRFSIPPEAVLQRADSPTNTSAPADNSANGRQAPAASTNSPRRKGVCCG